ncbi:MAG: GlsB/YeaQ/YmgE family stress response membrane protein [Acidobacteria bacterium]|nr:GlsB/YeaQ/YmgE family stress response membrane protein [Acidobacteriota bacterium]
MPGRDPGGFFVTIVIGIVGALLAGFLGRAIGWYDTNEGAGYIASILGAIILLALYRMVAGRKHVV